MRNFVCGGWGFSESNAPDLGCRYCTLDHKDHKGCWKYIVFDFDGVQTECKVCKEHSHLLVSELILSSIHPSRIIYRRYSCRHDPGTYLPLAKVNMFSTQLRLGRKFSKARASTISDLRLLVVRDPGNSIRAWRNLVRVRGLL